VGAYGMRWCQPVSVRQGEVHQLAVHYETRHHPFGDRANRGLRLGRCGAGYQALPELQELFGVVERGS